jgi:hypothetical protein
MIIDDVRRWLQRSGSIPAFITSATAYEISGVTAFLNYLEKKQKLEEFLADATLDSFSRHTRWLEGEYLSDDANSKKHLGILFASDAAEVVISEFEPLQNGSFKIVLIRGTADQWKARPEDALSESEIEQKVERACLYAWLVAYFESDPASATISVKPGRPAKAKNGKEVKRALAEIRTIVIDGVEKIFTTDGINFRVHARGWHVRRHNVREHERHYASGKVAIVRAFQRGDINLGFVSHESQAAQPETRFSVQPDKVFFDTEQKAKSTAAGK